MKEISRLSVLFGKLGKKKSSGMMKFTCGCQVISVSFPCVIITPDDARIITEGSDERRRFTDALFCQMDPLYLQHLIEYNRLLQQRNQLLRSLAERISTDRSLLDVYDAQLLRPGTYIFVKRQHFFHEILPVHQQSIVI